MTTQKRVEPKWGRIEEKDVKGNIINVKEGLVIGRGKTKRCISPDDVEAIAKTYATTQEMARILEIPENTLRYNFAEYIEKGRAETKIQLRKQQIKLALNGNATMLIWLGKNLLGQIG